jgi:hypothetical protein
VFQDLDGNGLLDAWEQLYFGRIGVDPSADADGDGLNNLSEHKAGTIKAIQADITTLSVDAGDPSIAVQSGLRLCGS